MPGLWSLGSREASGAVLTETTAMAMLLEAPLSDS